MKRLLALSLGLAVMIAPTAHANSAQTSKVRAASKNFSLRLAKADPRACDLMTDTLKATYVILATTDPAAPPTCGEAVQRLLTGTGDQAALYRAEARAAKKAKVRVSGKRASITLRYKHQGCKNTNKLNLRKVGTRWLIDAFGSSSGQCELQPLEPA